MVLFGSKKDTKIGRGEIPVEKVKNLLNKGFSEIEIIDMLRKDGYSPHEIDMALFQAVNEVKTLSQQQTQQTSNLHSSQKILQEGKHTYSELQTSNISTNTQSLNVSTSPAAEEKKAATSEGFTSAIDYISLEEYIDYILREKTQEINKRLIEINLRYKELEDKILNLKREIEDVTTKNREDINKILTEIRMSRETINELSIKIDALGKTIKELLPSLIESVKLLSEIVQKLKI